MEHNFNSSCNYKVDAPYPPIRVNGGNQIYALEMLSNVGGVISEMSAVSLYFYNSVITTARYPWISECFRRISITEMHHLNLFARLASLLGEDPKLWSGYPDRRWWTPAYNQYPTEIYALITNAIEGEKTAIRKYQQQAARIQDENIVAILHRIIQDEELHIQILSAMYSKI